MLSQKLAQRQELRQEQKQMLELSQSQKQLVRFLLRQELLIDDFFPNAARGFEGMKIAHNILQERGAAGILIGGLSEDIWERTRRIAELDAHKDVDVLVLSQHFKLTENFEGGIDWWMPRSAVIEYRADAGNTKIRAKQNWWANGYKVVLDYNLSDYPLPAHMANIPSGLYLPSPRWVASMRLTEAMRKVSSARLAQTDDILTAMEGFIQEMLKKVRDRLPPFLKDYFSQYILRDAEAEHLSFFPSERLQPEAHAFGAISAMEEYEKKK